MIRVGMEDTHPQHPTRAACTICGGAALVDTDGIYLCARDAVRSMGVTPQSEYDEPVDGVLKPAVLVDLSDVGKVGSTGTADDKMNATLVWRCSPMRRRSVRRHACH